MHKYLTIFALSTALTLSMQAIAHEDDGDIHFQRVGGFEAVDTNEDGKVSEKEYLAYEADEASEREMDWRQEHWAEMMEKFDENGDNQLEVQEIENYAELRIAEVMEKFHGRHGKWLEEFEFDFDDHEFTFRLEERLAEVDERIAEALERLHDREGRFFGDFEFDLEGMMGAHRFAFTGPHVFEFRGLPEQILKDLDENEDGTISQEEFVRQREKLFERLDENEDGVLDEEELENFSWFGNYAFKWHQSEEDEE